MRKVRRAKSRLGGPRAGSDAVHVQAMWRKATDILRRLRPLTRFCQTGRKLQRAALTHYSRAIMRFPCATAWRNNHRHRLRNRRDHILLVRQSAAMPSRGTAAKHACDESGLDHSRPATTRGERPAIAAGGEPIRAISILPRAGAGPCRTGSDLGRARPGTGPGLPPKQPRLLPPGRWATGPI